MKYIRTKDGIYKVTYSSLCFIEAKSQTMTMLVEYKNEKGKFEYAEITTHKTLAMGKYHFKEHILKQADTIEELCDEFIVTATSHYTAYIAYTLEEAIEYCANNRVPKTKIRGAIWTDKGLIYVAKINEKGELELL